MTADMLDLAALARILRRARLALVAGGLAGAVFGGVAAVSLWKYQSDGIYTLGAITAIEPLSESAADRIRLPPTGFPKTYRFTNGIKLQDFKLAYPQLDSEKFRQFVSHVHAAPDTSLNRIVERLESPQSRAEMLSPVYGSTRADVRELGDQSKPVENLVLALQISFAASDRSQAAADTTLLGDFVGESLFASEAAALVARRLEQYGSEQLVLENELIRVRFAIGTTSDKIKQLQVLRHDFPDVGNGTSRQVVSVADGGARYLSPVAQLVGLESAMADLREEIAVNERKRNVARLLAKYYRDAGQLTRGSATSQEFFVSVEKLIKTSFSRDGSDVELAEARNHALLDFQALRALREQGFRFSSGPTGGFRDASRVWKTVAGGAVLGVLLVALVALVAQATRDRLHR
jgi:hypothetical protein